MPDLAFPTSLETAIQFDQADPLSHLRRQFQIDEGTTYLVGHSLGPPTRAALKAIETTSQQDWASGLVGSWNNANWIDLPSIVGGKIARLIGVSPEDVIVCDSVSINLFKLVGALLSKNADRKRIIVEESEFPTDQYILERLAKMTGVEFVRAEASTAIDYLDAGSILVKSLVDYRNADVALVKDMEEKARARGSVIVWDLSHATGVVELKLSDWGVRYAVGCTYKYLNGGPGAPSFLYVDPDHVEGLETPLAGWLGHKRPFAFDSQYDPADGVQRFVAGTPPILSMAALNASLDIFDGVSMQDVSEKSRRLGDMCLKVFDDLGLESPSPREGSLRGGHVSLLHPSGYEVSRALSERGVKTDFRPPSTIRFGLSPLFLSHAEVWKSLDALRLILETRVYEDPRYAVKSKVT